MASEQALYDALRSGELDDDEILELEPEEEKCPVCDSPARTWPN